MTIVRELRRHKRLAVSKGEEKPEYLEKHLAYYVKGARSRDLEVCRHLKEITNAQVVTPEMHGVQVRWFESCGLGVGQNLLAENAGSDAIQ